MPPPTPFFCTLCGKGYARAPELEAHENSYDHQHKKRLREMKALTRNTGNAGDKPARRAARDADAVLGSNLQAPSKPVEVPEEVKEEMTVVRGPVPWEGLADVGDLVDLERGRPGEMQKFVDGRRDWLAVRREKGFYKEIWDAVDAAGADEEEEEERAGLGAGGYGEDSEEDDRPVGLGA